MGASRSLLAAYHFRNAFLSFGQLLMLIVGNLLYYISIALLKFNSNTPHFIVGDSPLRLMWLL